MRTKKQEQAILKNLYSMIDREDDDPTGDTSRRILEISNRLGI